MANLTVGLQREQQAYREHDEYEGVIGDENGNPYPPNQQSRLWVRFPQGLNASGITTYGAPRPVRYDGSAGVIQHGGVEVLVHKDPHDGIETITRVKPDWWDRAGIDSRTVNSGAPQAKWWDSPNFIRWLNRPTGNTTTSSTKVTTRENPFYWNDALDWATFQATNPLNQLDLASFIPAADTHRLVITYFDVLTAVTAAVGSTAQALDSDLDFTDYLECQAQLPHNECVPLTAYELADNQGSIDQNAVSEDLRSWIALPQVIGFPNPIVSGKSYLVRDTHQLLVYNLTVVGQLTIEGSVTIL